MERAFWKELDQAPPEVDLAPQRAGFVEQLDLDLHDGDIHERAGVTQ
jgi:hypothetical protein